MIVKTLEECFKDRKFKTDDLSAIYSTTLNLSPLTHLLTAESFNHSPLSFFVKGGISI